MSSKSLSYTTMAPPKSLVVLILFLHLADASAPAGKDPKAASSEKLPVETICGNALYPKVCTSIARPRVGKNTDPTVIVKLHLDSALRNSKHAIRQATDPEDEDDPKAAIPVGGPAVQTCVTAYQGSTDSIKKAIEAVVAGDKQQFMAYMSSIVSYYDECEAAFKGIVDDSFPHKRYAEKNRQFCGNAESVFKKYWNVVPPASATPASS